MKRQNDFADILAARRMCDLGERQRTAVRLLSHATCDAIHRTREILPTVGDVKAHPLPAAQDLTADEYAHRTLGGSVDEIAAYLADETRLAVPGHGGGLDDFADAYADLDCAIREMTAAKIATCTTVGNAEATAQFRAALAALPTALTDAEAFRASFRRALMLDAEATDLANGRKTEAQSGGNSTRSDAGRRHNPRRYERGWRTQEDVADDFDKAKFTPEKGAKPKGGCALSKIKRWDDRYPDATHAHPHCGYHAMLRTNPDLKNEYLKAVGKWREYWTGWRVAFKEWRKAHKASPITAFRYAPVKMVSGYSPDLIGTDADGNQYGTPDGRPRKRKP